jgi:acyl carrier protein
MIMDKDEIKSRIKHVIGQVLEKEESDIADDANFVFDLGASSMQSLQLIAAFEEEFSIEMEQEKAMEVQTVAGAVDFVSTYLI